MTRRRYLTEAEAWRWIAAALARQGATLPGKPPYLCWQIDDLRLRNEISKATADAMDRAVKEHMRANGDNGIVAFGAVYRRDVSYPLPADRIDWTEGRELRITAALFLAEEAAAA